MSADAIDAAQREPAAGAAVGSALVELNELLDTGLSVEELRAVAEACARGVDPELVAQEVRRDRAQRPET